METDYAFQIFGVIAVVLALILVVMWVMVQFILLGIRKDFQHNHEELMAIKRQLIQINIREVRRDYAPEKETADRPPVI